MFLSIVAFINNDYMDPYGGLWFLPCMFVADVYVRVLLGHVHKNRLARLVAMLALIVDSYLLGTIICAKELDSKLTAFRVALDKQLLRTERDRLRSKYVKMMEKELKVTESVAIEYRLEEQLGRLVFESAEMGLTE